MFKLITVFLLLVTNVSAAVWYSAADGNSTNGTYAQPWSMYYAAGTNANPHLQAGDTVIFKNGTYDVAVDSYSNHLSFVVSGVRYQPESLWGAKFDGCLHIPAASSNITIHGLMTYTTMTTNRIMTNDWIRYGSGFNENGINCKLTHNLIENASHPGIASWKTTSGKYIAGNLIRFTGVYAWDVENNRFGTPAGSGMYLQNKDNTSPAVIRGNISYNNFTTGMKAYGNTDIWGFEFAENIVTASPEGGIFYHQDNYGSSGLKVFTNYVWKSDTSIRIGYPLGNGFHSNAVVVGNYVVENAEGSQFPFYVANGWRNIVFTNNIGVSLKSRYMWQLDLAGDDTTNGAIVSSHVFNNNSYYATNYGAYGTYPFSIVGVAKMWTNWQADLGEAGSIYEYAQPTNIFTRAFRPSEDSNFVHVIVYNWTNSNSVAVNVSQFFSAGDSIKIYDAQNAPNAYTNLVLVGSSIELPLTLTNRVTPNGWTNEWSGFDPQLRAFIVYREASVKRTWYASATGNSTNGTYSLPWSILYAVTNTNPYLSGGDTVILKSGTYNAAESTRPTYGGTNMLVLWKSGDVDDPITYVAEDLWSFKLHGGILIPYGVHSLVIDGLDIYNTWTTNRNHTNNYAYVGGIDCYGSNVTVRHNLIRNTGHAAIGMWRTALNKVIEGNVIAFPGGYDWGTYNGSAMGGFTYLENEATDMRVNGNIAFGSYSSGHLIKRNLHNHGWTNNIVIEPGQNAFQLHIKQGEPIHNNGYYLSNFVFTTTATGFIMGSVDYGDYTPGSSNIWLHGNVIAGGVKALLAEGWWTRFNAWGNQFVRMAEYPLYDYPVTAFSVAVMQTQGQTNTVFYSFLTNSYYHIGGNWPFGYHALYTDWDGWRTNTGETGPHYSTHLPTNNAVYHFRPSSNTNHVRVMVYNWETNTSASVDLSSYFNSGDSIKVYDAQDVPNAYTNFTYAGGNISLPLNRTNHLDWWGNTNSWSGFEPRVRAFVVYRTASYGGDPAPGGRGLKIKRR